MTWIITVVSDALQQQARESGARAGNHTQALPREPWVSLPTRSNSSPLPFLPRPFPRDVNHLCYHYQLNIHRIILGLTPTFARTQFCATFDATIFPVLSRLKITPFPEVSWGMKPGTFPRGTTVRATVCQPCTDEEMAEMVLHLSCQVLRVPTPAWTFTFHSLTASAEFHKCTSCWFFFSHHVPLECFSNTRQFIVLFVQQCLDF